MPEHTDLEALMQALESQLDTIQYYYDRTSGEVVMISEEFEGENPEEIARDPRRFLLIPGLTTNERFKIMEDFIEALPNESLQDELNQALIEKGAFQRFEEVLGKYPTRREQWRRFRVDKVRARAQEWLRENGIEA